MENKIFTRTVVIRANNVTIRNCLWRSTSDFRAFYVQPGFSGALIEDVEIDGMGSASLDSGISGGGWTARRVDIHGMSDGVKLDSGVTLEDSYIHDLWTTAPLPHSDGGQSMGANGVTIRHNRISMTTQPGQNAALWFAPDFGPLSNFLVENNWLSGGGYTYWSRSIAGHVFRNNHFTRNAYQYGVVDIQGTVTRSGNVWSDTLQPIPGG